MVMWEFASRKTPYELASPTIISAVIPLGDREDIIEDCPPGYMDLVQLCWHQNPSMRPESSEILKKTIKIREMLPLGV